MHWLDLTYSTQFSLAYLRLCSEYLYQPAVGQRSSNTKLILQQSVDYLR